MEHKFPGESHFGGLRAERFFGDKNGNTCAIKPECLHKNGIPAPQGLREGEKKVDTGLL